MSGVGESTGAEVVIQCALPKISTAVTNNNIQRADLYIKKDAFR